MKIKSITQTASAQLGLSVGDNRGMDLRSSTVTPVMFDGEVVTTQEFYAQAEVAGASPDDMALALGGLLGDPAADPPVAPDSTMLDAIMGA